MKHELSATVVELAAPGEPFETDPTSIPACPDVEELRFASPPAPTHTGSVVLGVLLGFGSRGEPLISHRGSDPLPACSIVPLGPGDLGREVVIGFEEGEPERPIILGIVQPPLPSQHNLSGSGQECTKALDVRIDGERLILTADKEIVLRCGEASITLTPAGKVLIRGSYVLSRSTGMNRIQGGSVHIN